jgi:hypothetical protein
LATNRETPIITISRGTVSSQRMDVNDQARLMQIDGDLNPGNSGGPIVDDAGQVVGVAVATVRRTNIGFAIPLAPVVEMLAGTLTDLQGELSAGGVRVRARLLDPLDRFESARLHVRAMKEDAVLDLLGDDESWQPIAPKAKAIAFTRKDDETLEAEHALPDSVAADRVLVAQITLNANGVDRYLPPFRLKANALSLALTGPDVSPADSDDALAKDGASDTKNSRSGGTDKVATMTGTPSTLDELFTRSGVSGLIASMGTSASEDLDQATSSDDEQTVRERLRKIIAAQWDEERIKRTFVRSFEATPNADAQRRATELFDLPAMKLLHMTNDRLAPLSAKEAEALKKWRKRDPGGFDKRVELMREIDEKRQFTRIRMDALKTAIGSLSRLLNEIKPANTRMSQALLMRDLERNIAQLERRVRGAVPVMLVNQYKDADEADLRDYLKQLDSIAMRWFTESEFAAGAAVIKAQFSEAEDAILQLFKEVRRESLGLAEPPDLQDKTDEQVMNVLMQTYGKPGVIEYVLKRRGGEIHIQRGGGMQSQFGRPGQDSVNAKTMTADLQAMKIQSKAFADELAQFLVDKAYKEQRLTTNVRTARLIDALKERRRAKALLGGKTRKARQARKKELWAMKKEKHARSKTCEKTCKTQRSSCYKTESTSYGLCRQTAPSSGKERSRTLSACSQQRRGKHEACKAEASQCSSMCR